MISKIVSSQVARVGWDIEEGVYEAGDGAIVIRTTRTPDMATVVIHGNISPTVLDEWVRTINEIEER